MMSEERYVPSWNQTVADINKPKESMKNWVKCRGVFDIVFDKDANAIGRVGFHEIDEKWGDIIKKVYDASYRLMTPITLLETLKGYHLVSFEILDMPKWEAWRVDMHKNFPSDYSDGICDVDAIPMLVAVDKRGIPVWRCRKCKRESFYSERVLRVSEKGEISKPHQTYWAWPKGIDPTLAFGHYKFYQNEGIVGDVPSAEFKFEKTGVGKCDYLTPEFVE